MIRSEAETEAMIAALRAEMATNGHRRDDPVRVTTALMGDRWSPLILLVLGMDTWRQADLRRVLGRLSSEGEISQRVLTLKLRALEREGFVARHATGHVPPQVTYGLTDLGRELQEQVYRQVCWVAERKDRIEAARAHFDRAHFDRAD